MRACRSGGNFGKDGRAQKQDRKEKNSKIFSFSLPWKNGCSAYFKMKATKSFPVESQDTFKRLDVFLSQKESGLSRSQIKRLIGQGNVQVGGRKAKAGMRLKKG